MKNKVLFILFFIIILTFMLPINAFAAENNLVRVEITGKVDPRIAADNEAVYLGIYSYEEKEIIGLYLYEESNYEHTMLLPTGNYDICEGMVTGDYDAKYSIQYQKFYAQGLTTKVSIEIGDYDYSGEVTERENTLPGDLNREETDRLLQEDGQNPVNWDDIDNHRDTTTEDYEFNFDAGGVSSDIPGIQIEPFKPPVEENDPTAPTEPDETTPQDTTRPSDETEPTENPEPTGPPKTEEEKQKESQMRFLAILFVIAIIALCGFAIYNKMKNAPIDEEDTQ